MSVLHNMDFNLGPISISEIEPHLYLGGLAAAKDAATLKKYNITHILTVDICPLPQFIQEMKKISIMFIQISDQPYENLIAFFDQAVEFIEKGVNEGNILVHCYFGVSRSATLVTAYIMKKYFIGFSVALEKVKEKRSLVCPNIGFVEQLKLYFAMGLKLDNDFMRYKQVRLRFAADRVKKTRILPQEYQDLIKPDPGLQQVQPEPNVYRCGKCRRVLACESNLLTHEDEGQICKKAFFIEPLQWMNCTSTNQEKLYCPKCNNKVGSFSWIMGCQCPCGIKISPAFYLKPSKVDFCNVVKNVEITF